MPIIAVLEDDQRRITAIRAAGQTQLTDHDIRIFVSAREMIAWLSGEPQDVRLISLDCDLDSTALHDDTCGSGEDVTAFLACNIPECAVLIHSSNAMRAPAMHMELAMAGCRRVVLCPFQDSDSWATDVRRQLAAD
jgi:hypothetical protein